MATLLVGRRPPNKGGRPVLRVASKVEAAPAVVAAIGARRVLRVGDMVEAALAVVVAIDTNTVNNVVAIGTIGKGGECPLVPLSDHTQSKAAVVAMYFSD